MYKFTGYENSIKTFTSSDLVNDIAYLPTNTAEGNSEYAVDSVSVKMCPVGSECIGSDATVAKLFDNGWKML